MVRRLSLIRLGILIMSVVPLLADNGPAHQAAQTPPVKLGTSGGNVNDITHAFCCSGTLGSLVTKGGVGYILSNSHVLARVGQAAVGEDVSQPGLVDNGCRVFQVVADYSETAPLDGSSGSNVDAALAQVRPLQVDPLGTILDVGIPSSSPATPAVGMAVSKSGRTTGLTCAGIGSTNTTVRVQYQKNCGSGRKFTITYTNQVVVNSTSFSAGGDSGSLIVATNTAQPVALLYAGSSSSTIGNPIQDVISALGVSFVGGLGHAVSCTGSAAPAGSSRGASQAALDHAAAVKEAHIDDLMNTPAVQGVGVGVDDNGNAVIIIYTELGRPEGFIPDMIDGVRTQIVRSETFRAFDWVNEDLQQYE
jgi:hypothetical protein